MKDELEWPLSDLFHNNDDISETVQDGQVVVSASSLAVMCAITNDLEWC